MGSAGPEGRERTAQLANRIVHHQGMSVRDAAILLRMFLVLVGQSQPQLGLDLGGVAGVGLA
jgi:hypothetical protein